MKHLRKFNESKDNLQDFCDNCLAYLYDEGMGINIYEIGHNTAGPAYVIWFDKRITEEGRQKQEMFYWDSIKEYYITFAKLLNRNYDIIGFRISEGEGQVTKDIINIDTIINDSFDRNIKLRTIGVVVKK